ncbi:hypothetical protein PUN28_009760 [Cardiocondyla obscurior]|uniref:Major facilitator superfamily associated domain-containing protein n=1 Tax=Cardiocondyla obscurior TaxID=286306 RepID=A0AAW2FNQ0_9HYME
MVLCEILTLHAKLDPPHFSLCLLRISAGSFIGGILYKKFGGLITLRIFSVFALFSAFIYFVLYVLYLKHKISDTRNNVKWRQPDDAQNHCVIADT